MKKIAMFINVDWFFFSHRLPIARASKRNDVDMSVYTEFTEDHSGKWDHEFKLIQSPINRTSKSFIHTFFEFINAHNTLRAASPDLIHAVSIKPILITGIIARIQSIPFIGAISGLGPAFQANSFIKRIRLWLVIKLFRFIFRNSKSNIICQTASDRDALVDRKIISTERVTLIPGSGVDIKKFIPNAEASISNKYILMSSRILRDKGIEEFCKAAKIVNDKLEEKVKFKLSGIIDSHSPTFLSEEELKEITLRYGVEFLGNRKDMPALLASALMFVLPSYYAEGIPKVLLEAASCGLPIITTDHPGCRDAIKDQETGILIPPKNSLALADAIIRLLENPKLMTQMGVAARSFAEEKFKQSRVVDLHYDIYQQLSN